MSENNPENQLSMASSNGVRSEDEKAKSKINHLKDSVETIKKQSNNNGNDSQSSSDVENIRPETEELPEGVRRGVCKWFNSKKGFGFVTPDDGGKDVFVHQRVIKKDGFRSLRENEHVEFTCHESDKGLEATLVTGPGGQYCKGSKKVYPSKKLRCYNCGDFANHIAAKCSMGPMPKRCHSCKSVDHLIADCPKSETKEVNSPKFIKTPRKKSERQKSRPKLKSEECDVDENQSMILSNQNGDEINDKKDI